MADRLPISVRFERFHRENPAVYEHLLMLARRAKRSGATRLGAKQLAEVFRWRVMLATRDDSPWKLDNSFVSHYARLLNAEPDLHGLFELRQCGADEVRDA